MQIRQSWVVFGLIIAPLLINSSDIKQTLDESAEVRSANARHNKAEAAAQNLANQRLAESQTALARVQAACVSVVDVQTGKEAPMVEGEPVSLEDMPHRSFGDGALICNSLGDTAEVWQGEINYVASAAPEDMNEYLEMFEKQRKRTDVENKQS